MFLRYGGLMKSNAGDVGGLPLSRVSDKTSIRRDDESVKPTPRPVDWRRFFALNAKASDDFMAGVERLPVQERPV
ncbi:hypothetical protein QTI66_00875 [Variovorax sp. J22R133]|uniref:hypothetical protein n=1 Tax=Variovorax brevis TaxID=3053503 RepID=UPI0025782A4A|nr:hypothetical protein [Variovorax sp. J22R133]MDM0110678.1 hypothetical protein [Variovorax sp. J22R133]